MKSDLRAGDFGSDLEHNPGRETILLCLGVLGFSLPWLMPHKYKKNQMGDRDAMRGAQVLRSQGSAPC